MSCRNPKTPDHRWQRAFDIRTSAHNGRRDEYSCNDCLAIKIVFSIWKGDEEIPATSEFVVEPAGQ